MGGTYEQMYAALAWNDFREDDNFLLLSGFFLLSNLTKLSNIFFGEKYES
jgi:hypothetical protein